MLSERKKLEQCAREALKKAGVKKGEIVLDCCCGMGYYSIPASSLVGEEGLVYAIDSDRGRLHELEKFVKLGLAKNIKIMQEDVEKKISLPDNSVDVVLLYDIFWYFRPSEENLSRLLLEIQRIVKPYGLISVFPTHIDSNQLQFFKNKMNRLGFTLVSKLQCDLVHEKNIESGKLLNYRK
ncbi:MAG: class I SAM-dependent methyltransferase [Atribacterota bacterium]